MNRFYRMCATALSVTMLLTALTACGTKAPADGSTSTPAASSSAPAASTPDVSANAGDTTDMIVGINGMAGDTVLATVNGIDVTAAEVLYQLAYQIGNYEQYFAQYGMTEITWDVEVSEGVTLKEDFMNQAYYDAALYALIPSMTKAEGFTLEQEDLDYVQSSLDQMYETWGSDEVKNLIFSQAPINEADYRTMMSNGILMQKLAMGRFGEGGTQAPTDEELVAYAKDGLGMYKAKHILLKTVDTNTPLTDESGYQIGYTPLSEEDVAAQKALAEDILAQLKASDDVDALFDELREEYTEDVGMDGSVNGPEGYTAEPGDMVPEFETAAKSVAPGEVSEIVESSYGYHIVMPMSMDELDEATKSAVLDAYIGMKMGELESSWMEAYPMEKTDAGADLDAEEFYTALTELRETTNIRLDEIMAEQAAAASADAGASSSVGG